MRWLSLGALALSACGFGGAQGSGDDGVAIDAAIDGADESPTEPDGDTLVPDADPDAPPDASPAITCRTWTTEFNTDPTTSNGPSGEVEWRMRDGGALDGTVTGGTWKTNGPSGALDSTPLDDFEGVTTIDVRMKDLSMTGGGFGAVIWVNAGFADGVIVPVVMALDRTGASSQQFTLFVKPDANTMTPLHEEPNLDASFQTLHLEVDTVTGEERHSINGGSLVVNDITEAVSNTSDRFVTAIGFGSDAEFDYLRVTNCPPGAVPEP